MKVGSRCRRSSTIPRSRSRSRAGPTPPASTACSCTTTCGATCRRRGDGALECFALLGAVAAETRRVQLGTLVARAALRPPAIARARTRHGAARQRRPAHRRARCGRQPDQGRERSVRPRVRRRRRRAWRRSMAAVQARSTAAAIRCGSAASAPACARSSRAPTAGTRGVGPPPRSRAERRSVREVAPAATLTWGGLVLLGRDDEHAAEKARTAPGRAARRSSGGPDRVARAAARRTRMPARRGSIVGPLDATDPDERRCARRARPAPSPTGRRGIGAGSVVSVEQE